VTRTTVLVEKEILEAVVVDVAPERAHRHTGAGAIHVGDAQRGRDVLERAVAAVAIEAIEATLSTVRDVEIRPAIAIEISDRHRRAHRRDLRHDVREARVEGRALMHEVDADALGGLLQPKPVTVRTVAGDRAGDGID
jgi:hypothetical protein